MYGSLLRGVKYKTMNAAQQTLAIDIALLPPNDIMERAKEMNTQLWEQTQKGFRFDESHLPHITLLQQFIHRSNLEQVVATITETIASTPAINITIAETHLGSLQEGGFQISDWRVEPTAALSLLHQKIFSSLELFVTTGDRAGFFLDPGEEVRELTWQWTNNFRASHNDKAFAPHLTLGNGRAEPVEPFSFTSSRLALCQLGNFNTCRKILHEWSLQ